MSTELALITHIKDEPLALLILLTILFIRVMEPFVKWIYQTIFHKHKKTIEELFSEYDKKREVRHKEEDNKFEHIEMQLKELFSIVETHEISLKKESINELKRIFFNDSKAVYRRLEIFRILTALDVNGRVKIKGLELILQNKDMWLDVLETELSIEIINPDYYRSVMDEIKRRIFDGVIK